MRGPKTMPDYASIENPCTDLELECVMLVVGSMRLVP
jgi:hypothetical protein